MKMRKQLILQAQKPVKKLKTINTQYYVRSKIAMVGRCF